MEVGFFFSGVSDARLVIFQLRNAMVNRKTGTFSMEVKKTIDKGVRKAMQNDVNTRKNGI